MSRAISRRNQKRIGEITNASYPAAAVPANSTAAAYTTVNIPGIGLNDTVAITLQTPSSGIIVDAYVSAPGVVTVRAHNITTGSITPTASTMQVQCQFR